jgi:transposase InsO family protein
VTEPKDSRGSRLPATRWKDPAPASCRAHRTAWSFSFRGPTRRGVGWEYLHLAIDDHSRVAYSEILPDEKRGSCLRFLFNALRFFRAHGVKVQRVMIDNGVSFRSRRYAKALRLLKIKHLRTRPYTPKTNGKAERFVQTSLREWATLGLT